MHQIICTVELVTWQHYLNVDNMNSTRSLNYTDMIMAVKMSRFSLFSLMENKNKKKRMKNNNNLASAPKLCLVSILHYPQYPYALSLHLHLFCTFHSLFNFHSIQNGICLLILSLFTIFTLMAMFAMHCHCSSSQVCCLYLQCLHLIYPKYIKAVLKICIVYIGERKIETSTT